MTDNTTRAWQDEARDRLRTVSGLTANDARVHFAIDQNATSRATAIEAALGKTTDAIQHQSEVTDGLGTRLEQALAHAGLQAQQASADLSKAIHALVEASNSSTRTMAGLQRWIIILTAAYVILTAVIAFATLQARS